MSASTSIPDLGPLYEPAPVPFHFETPGWYVLGGTLLLIMLVLLVKWIKNYLHNAYRRSAIDLIRTIEQQFVQQSEIDCFTEVFVILKQVAITTYGRNTVANLHGSAWLEFLDSKIKHPVFAPLNVEINNILYRNHLENKEEAKTLFELSKKWIKHHDHT